MDQQAKALQEQIQDLIEEKMNETNRVELLSAQLTQLNQQLDLNKVEYTLLEEKQIGNMNQIAEMTNTIDDIHLTSSSRQVVNMTFENTLTCLEMFGHPKVSQIRPDFSPEALDGLSDEQLMTKQKHIFDLLTDYFFDCKNKNGGAADMGYETNY